MTKKQKRHEYYLSVMLQVRNRKANQPVKSKTGIISRLIFGLKFTARITPDAVYKLEKK